MYFQGVMWPAMHDMTAKWIPQNERSKFVSAYMGSYYFWANKIFEIVKIYQLFLKKYINLQVVPLEQLLLTHFVRLLLIY